MIVKNFEDLIDKLRKGYDMENITEGKMVECIGNTCYEDDDLYNFLYSIGADIEDYGVGYAIISTTSDRVYEIPYEVRENRFGEDLLNETVLLFEYSRIYDVTDNY